MKSVSRFSVLLWLGCLALTIAGCGYTTRPGLAGHLRTIHVKPFVNKIDVTRVTTNQRDLPLYRHRMEADLTNGVIERFQFTGLLRPVGSEKADCTLEGELVEFRRDALRSDSDQNIEEWRLNLVVNLRFYDHEMEGVLWDVHRFTGDTTYFSRGPKAESESAALDRAVTDLSRRIVERVVEDW